MLCRSAALLLLAFSALVACEDTAPTDALDITSTADTSEGRDVPVADTSTTLDTTTADLTGSDDAVDTDPSPQDTSVQDTAADTAVASDTTAGDTTTSTEYPAFCLPACNTVADCFEAGAPTLLDADNYACEAGLCRWTGCNSDNECLAGYLCQHLEGTLPLCYPPCNTADDCAFTGSEGSAYDGDNYICDTGVCRWQGCNTDAECKVFDVGHVCRTGAALVPLCVYSCTTPADCDAGGGAVYDADNYACDAGVCQWTGCNSDSECQTGGSGDRCISP